MGCTVIIRCIRIWIVKDGMGCIVNGGGGEVEGIGGVVTSHGIHIRIQS
jgi:hypothetical protein